MSQIAQMGAVNVQPMASRHFRFKIWKPALAAAAAAALLLAVASIPHWFGRRGTRGPEPSSGFALLAQAQAAEEALFAGQGIVRIVNEIVVKAVSDPGTAAMRWMPLMSLDATGKPRFHELSLPAEPGQEYIVEDRAWYDPPTGRFARTLTVKGRPVFANSYDGEAVYWLETGSDGKTALQRTPAAEGFVPPRNPAELLGIAAGFASAVDEKDKSMVSDAGDGTLADGSAVRVLKVGFAVGGPEGMPESYWLFRVRKDNNVIAEMEWVLGEESLLLTRRTQTGTVEKPEVPWNLEGIVGAADEAQDGGRVRISADMVILNASVRQMVEKADFETYVFKSDPSWAGERQITDILDLPSPPHRMFCITYRAKDGRHVVLVQSYSYNMMLGSVAKGGQMVYESPSGFKVRSSAKGQWLANILLQSARAFIVDPPAKDCVGYLLESPSGTFPALAINGPLTDEELHGLIESLAPARERMDEEPARGLGNLDSPMKNPAEQGAEADAANRAP